MENCSNEIKRWTAKCKVQAVMDVLKGKTTVVEVSRQHDLPPAEQATRCDLPPIGWTPR